LPSGVSPTAARRRGGPWRGPPSSCHSARHQGARAAHIRRGAQSCHGLRRAHAGPGDVIKLVELRPSANVLRTITGLLEWRAAVDKRTNKRARPILAQCVAVKAELRNATTSLIGALSVAICILLSIVQSSSYVQIVQKSSPSAQTSLSVLLAASASTSAPMPVSVRWSWLNTSCDDGEGSHAGRDVIQPRQMPRQR